MQDDTQNDLTEADEVLIEPDLQSEPSLYPDGDSGLGDDMSIISSTGSLGSSMLRDIIENGRVYHGYKDGKYVLPIDEMELERQARQYQLCLFTFDNRLNYAPLSSPHRVLDVGTGTGFWAFDFGEKHPESEVIGVDLSPIQPEFVPPNVQFQVDDLEEPWNFSFHFDYIHLLMMTGAFRDWPNVFRQSFDFLNSDGWFEIQDIEFPLYSDDGTLKEGPS